MYSDRRGDGQIPLRTKPSRQKPPRKEPPRTKTNHPVKTYVCMHILLKLGGSEMCDRGEGGQNWSKIAWRTL